jgi:beta-glucosidase
MPRGQGGTQWQKPVWFPTSPLKALRAQFPNAKVDFASGRDLTEAAKLAKAADVAIVFAYQWEAEGMDLPGLSLPDGQDALIEKVAAANLHTVVVLETGTAVTMPWKDKVAGIVEVWYAGSSGHKALVNVLSGQVNPSGKLAMTFPLGEHDLPHATIPPLSPEDEGQGTGAVNGRTHTASKYSVTYDEGARVGYKWYESERKPVLFPFGFGLSYTTYAYSGLRLEGQGQHRTAAFSVKNAGTRDGVEIAQVYVTLPTSAGVPYKRLAGWKRVELKAGESRNVSVAIDSRVLGIFQEESNDWKIPSGIYHVAAGPSSAETPLTGEFEIH